MRTPIILVVFLLALVLVACSSQVNEGASGTVMGTIPESELSAGRSARTTFDLSPGKYVLICNIPGHYKDGMFEAFQVDGLEASRVNTVSVVLGEWFIRPEPTSLSAGPITFEVNNSGKSDHNLVVIKTDMAPNALVVKWWAEIAGHQRRV